MSRFNVSTVVIGIFALIIFLSSGMEQGFTVSERPEGAGILVPSGDLSESIEARTTPDGRPGSFLRGEEEVPSRGEPLVTDAGGTRPPSSLTLECPGCIHPDPSWWAESDQAGAKFGWRVSFAGDVNGDGYDDVIVGAPLYDDPFLDEGRAYVYHGGPAGFEDTASWTKSGGQQTARLGLSVAGAGDVNGDGYDDIIVGAYAYNTAETERNRGRVRVYLGSSSGAVDTFCWETCGDQDQCMFGYAVAGAGDVNGDGYDDIIIGAHGYDIIESGEGRAYIFHGGAAGPSPSPSWIGEIAWAHAQFGVSVDGAGDVNGDGYDDVIVGAFMYEPLPIDEGNAFVFLGSDTGVVDDFCWMVEDEQEDTGLGWSVAGAGDVNGDGFDDVIVGAFWYDKPDTNEGTAYLFLGGSTGPVDTFSWMAEGDQEHAWFGCSVDGAGDLNDDGYDDVIVGAYGYNNLGSNEGRAYAYLGGAGGLSTIPCWIAEGNRNYVRFGNWVAGGGHVNGDEYADIVVGAFEYSNPEEEEGRVYLYFGCYEGVAVMIRHFASAWRDDHAEITWALRDPGSQEELTFDIARRPNPGGRFTPLRDPDIAREGERFTLRDYSIEPGGAFTYRVTILEDGEAAASFEVDLDTPAYSLMLHQNHPNPFNPVTTISYYLPAAAHVTLDIYDVSGRRIARLVDETQSGGSHTIDWRGLDQKGNPASSGTYIYRIRAGKEVLSRKMILLR